MSSREDAGARNFQSSILLWPILVLLSMVYGLGMALRLAAYRTGIFRTARAAFPVISVGNLTVGGAGKTPMVDYLIGEALRAGRNPVCISRGYGRRGRSRVIRERIQEPWRPDPRYLGDEPALLASRHPGVPVYLGRRRAEAARLAALWDAPDLAILDDGFQHLGLARDLNLLMIDAERGLGNGRLLPRGPLREPASAMKRADAVILTKALPGQAEALEARIRAQLPERIPVFRCGYAPRGIRLLDGSAEFPPQSLAGRELSLVCGIAQPEGFARTVESLGARVRERLFFPDHHPYPPQDLERLERMLATGESAPSGDPPALPAWLTTEKDAVKLRGRLEHAGRLGVLEMALQPEPDAARFFFDFIESCGIT